MKKNLLNLQENSCTKRNVLSLFFIIGICLLSNLTNLSAQTLDPEPGVRAEWMRGTYGLNWKPEGAANGNGENLYIDAFLEQIEGLRAVDYIQLHLGESFTTSSVHLGPHPILESLWRGDTDANGSPINLVVPRAVTGRDPFLDMLKAVKAKGLKTQVYVNSSNLLLRRKELKNGTVILPNPEEIPNITERWMEWCDTDSKAQEYITYMRSKSWFNIDGDFPERKYMFCYAKFILRDYAIRYGDLIDAWIFDSGKMMFLYNGDDRDSGELIDQHIYKAFADALHEGNPNAAVSFNNSVGSYVDGENPYSSATLFDDYMFGHPFYSGNNVGDHVENERLMLWSIERNGYAHTNDPNQSRTWDDKVVAHFDPPLSKTSWNGGSEPALSDENFVAWYGPYVTNGAAVSLGLPLVSQINWNNLFAKDFAMTQLELLDAYLMEHQAPEKANWARQETILTDAYVGQEYAHELILGKDFWDPEGDDITNLYPVDGAELPSWLSVKKSGDNYVLTGLVTDMGATSYTFKLRIKNEAGLSTRSVTLNVAETEPIQYTTAQIRATINTNYGIGEVATMISEVLTAPDGLATYQVELKVTPPSDKAIVSGASGGDATAYAWGMGDGTDATNDALFNGDDQDWVKDISDVVIKNFQSNGSMLSIVDVVFESITIANGQSVSDAIKFDFNNGMVKNVGNLFSNIEAVNLGIESLATPITNFNFGTGSQNVSDPTKNKWSVEGMNVRVSFGNESAVTEFYGVKAKVLLEGYYDSGAQEMHTKLQDKGLLPMLQPFNSAPWNYAGTESATTLPSTAVDWVLLMLRAADGTIINQAAGFIDKAGNLLDVEGKEGIQIVGAENQYLSIHTRSHLAIFSANPYTEDVYDFTTANTQAQGTEQLKLVSGKYFLHAGDYDGNGIINNLDFNKWKLQSAKLNEYLPIDGDGNGVINVMDYNLWFNNRSKIGEEVIQY